MAPDTFPPIIFEDEALMVINKPAGLIIQKSHTHAQRTLEDMLPVLPNLERGGLVHRLDRDTSGVMIVAKTPSAQQFLQEQFAERLVDKEYIALVWDQIPEDHAIIDAPIARHPAIGHKYVVTQEGKNAKTEVWKVQFYDYGGQVVSLIRLKLYTGRTHQVRVHCAAWAHPVVGDTVYGRRKDPCRTRQFLHAAYVSFNHPLTQQPVEFRVPLAPDLQEFLDTLTPHQS